MSKHRPSPAQLTVYGRRPAERPVVLIYQLSDLGNSQAKRCTTLLTALATQHEGVLRWAGVEEQVLIGPVKRHQRVCAFHFSRRANALRFVESAEHAAAVKSAKALLVSVCSEQPRALVLLSAVLARLLPKLPLDRRVEGGDEPYLGTSTMPTHPALSEFRAHPEQQVPLTMINWLKFRDCAAYEASASPLSGRKAYMRYGKVAMRTTHALGAKLLFAARYQQVLIGNGGDAGEALWDECALMQYPGRATFDTMSSLRIYRQALVHRQAGLAENGQALTVAKPDARFVWPAGQGAR